MSVISISFSTACFPNVEIGDFLYSFFSNLFLHEYRVCRCRAASSDQSGRLDTGSKGHVAPLVFMEVEWQASGFSVQEHFQIPPSQTHIPGPTWFLVCLEVQRICPSRRFPGELEDCTLKE